MTDDFGTLPMLPIWYSQDLLAQGPAGVNDLVRRASVTVRELYEKPTTVQLRVK